MNPRLCSVARLQVVRRQVWRGATATHAAHGVAGAVEDAAAAGDPHRDGAVGAATRRAAEGLPKHAPDVAAPAQPGVSSVPSTESNRMQIQWDSSPRLAHLAWDSTDSRWWTTFTRHAASCSWDAASSQRCGVVAREPPVRTPSARRAERIGDARGRSAAGACTHATHTLFHT